MPWEKKCTNPLWVVSGITWKVVVLKRYFTIFLCGSSLPSHPRSPFNFVYSVFPIPAPKSLKMWRLRDHSGRTASLRYVYIYCIAGQWLTALIHTGRCLGTCRTLSLNLERSCEKEREKRIFYPASESCFWMSYFVTTWDRFLLVCKASALHQQRKQQPKGRYLQSIWPASEDSDAAKAGGGLSKTALAARKERRRVGTRMCAEPPATAGRGYLQTLCERSSRGSVLYLHLLVERTWFSCVSKLVKQSSSGLGIF